MHPRAQPQNCKVKAVRVPGEIDTLNRHHRRLKTPFSEITDQADKNGKDIQDLNNNNEYMELCTQTDYANFLIT